MRPLSSVDISCGHLRILSTSTVSMIPAPRGVPMMETPPSLASMHVSGHRLAFGGRSSSGEVIRTIKGPRWPLLMLEATTAMVGLARFLVANVHHGGRQGRGDRGR